MSDIKRVIIDVDVGTDDYLAILLLLYSAIIGKIKIEAIFCATGNTGVDYVAENVVRLLELVNRTDIPVYKGAQNPIIPPAEPLAPYYGIDGFGDLKYDKEPDMSVVKNIPSAIALRDIIVNNPKEISLICVAAMTNLGLALKLYDDVADNIKDVWIMGGNYKGVGNVTPNAEFNFYVDPEAAFIALGSLKCPIHMFPLETCLDTKITLDWRYNVLGNDSPALDLLTRAEKATDQPGAEFWMPCDGFAVFAFLDPENNILRQSSHYATVELHNASNRGEVLLDQDDNEPNVSIIEAFAEESFIEFVLNVKVV